jgi:hypothetical protein
MLPESDCVQHIHQASPECKGCVRQHWHGSFFLSSHRNPVFMKRYEIAALQDKEPVFVITDIRFAHFWARKINSVIQDHKFQ